MESWAEQQHCESQKELAEQPLHFSHTHSHSWAIDGTGVEQDLQHKSHQNLSMQQHHAVHADYGYKEEFFHLDELQHDEDQSSLANYNSNAAGFHNCGRFYVFDTNADHAIKQHNSGGVDCNGDLMCAPDIRTATVSQDMREWHWQNLRTVNDEANTQPPEQSELEASYAEAGAVSENAICKAPDQLPYYFTDNLFNSQDGGSSLQYVDDNQHRLMHDESACSSASFTSPIRIKPTSLACPQQRILWGSDEDPVAGAMKEVYGIRTVVDDPHLFAESTRVADKTCTEGMWGGFRSDVHTEHMQLDTAGDGGMRTYFAQQKELLLTKEEGNTYHYTQGAGQFERYEPNLDGEKHAPLCDCRVRARRSRVRKQTVNHGRWFYRCGAHYGGRHNGTRCNFFQWI